MSIPAEDAYLDSDKLPQPYRTVAKVINKIINDAWEVIEGKAKHDDKAEFTEEGKDVVKIDAGKVLIKSPVMDTVDTEVFVGKDDGGVERWNTIMKDKTLDLPEVHDGKITLITATYAAVATSDGVTTKFIDLSASPDPIQHLLHPAATKGLVLSPCGEYLASATIDAINLYEIFEATPPRVFLTIPITEAYLEDPYVFFTVEDEPVRTTSIIVGWPNGYEIVQCALRGVGVGGDDDKTSKKTEQQQQQRKVSKSGKTAAVAKVAVSGGDVRKAPDVIRKVVSHNKLQILSISESTRTLAAAFEGGFVKVEDTVTHEVLLTTTIDFRRASRPPSTHTMLDCTAMSLWKDEYIATAWGLRCGGSSTVVVHDFSTKDLKVGDRTHLGVVRGSTKPGTLQIQDDSGGQLTAPTDIPRTTKIGEIKRIPSVKGLHFCRLAPLLAICPSTSRVAVYDVKSGRVTSIIPTGSTALGCGGDNGLPITYPTQDYGCPLVVLVGAVLCHIAAPSSPSPVDGSKVEHRYPRYTRPRFVPMSRFSDGFVIKTVDGSGGVVLTPVALPILVASAYPLVGKALSTYAGVDHIYSLLSTSYWEDLHDGSWLQDKILTAGVPSGGGKRTTLCGSLRGGKPSKKSITRVGFEAMDASVIAPETEFGSSEAPQGAKAKCMAYTQARRKEKAQRRARVAGMLSELHKFL